jgi:uncharacterized membrane protein YhhN
MIAGCLAGHALAEYRHISWLRAATRCPLMLLLAGYAASHGDQASHHRDTVRPLVGGLVCAAVGDTVLMRESDGALLAGIVAFLGTHTCYTAGFLRTGALARVRRRPLVPAVSAAAYLTVSAALWPRLGRMRWPVLGYGLALFAMASAACATGWKTGLGATLFVLSDVTIGLGVAGHHFPGQRAVIATTYVAGQLLLTHHWPRTTTCA